MDRKDYYQALGIDRDALRKRSKRRTVNWPFNTTRTETDEMLPPWKK